MSSKQTNDLGALILRVALGSLFLIHGAYLKVVVFTVPGTVQFFESLGLPALLAYAVIVGEILGGLALIGGVAVRAAALGLIPVALGAVWVHAGNGWLFTNTGGGWEFPMFLAIAALAQALIGGGAYSLTSVFKRDRRATAQRTALTI